MKHILYLAFLFGLGSVVDQWSCSNCGEENPEWRRRCSVCLTSKKVEGERLLTSDN